MDMIIKLSLKHKIILITICSILTLSILSYFFACSHIFHSNNADYLKSSSKDSSGKNSTVKTSYDSGRISFGDANEGKVSKMKPILICSDVKVITDKSIYNSRDMSKIMITNKSDKKYFTWFGPCSLVLEEYAQNKWVRSQRVWSLCPPCVRRESANPLFLAPTQSVEIKWDQSVAWCENESTRRGLALGRLRFRFRFAEDTYECRFAFSPSNCWSGCQKKIWQDVYSNEFEISEH